MHTDSPFVIVLEQIDTTNSLTSSIQIPRRWTNRPISAADISIACDASRIGKKLNMMSILTRTRTNLRLGSLMAAMSVLLSACALAPAMRMDSSPSLPVSNAGDQAASEWTASRDSDSAVASTSSIETPDGDRAATSESLAVPISDINVTLIQKLRQEEARQSADHLRVGVRSRRAACVDHGAPGKHQRHEHAD